jgi:4-hydroxy-3-methylbut-2-enyl diphosphate reductase
MVEVARDHGAGVAHLVEDATAIDEAWLDGVGTVGLSSGASVPEILVTDVLAWLAERGYGEVEEVNAADEKQSFALPRELRRLATGS